MMHDLGLKNIDIRVCDKANFNLNGPSKKALADEKMERRKKPYYNPETYINAGLDSLEAQRHVEGIIRTEDYEESYNGALPVVSAMAWLVSYGEKQ